MVTASETWNEAPDDELVRTFSSPGKAGREQAFGELVRRHVGVVYAAARRQTGNAALAEDVTQAVFLVLAQKAAGLHEESMLGGWLLKVTRYAAIDAMRKEAATRRRERAVAGMRREAQEAADTWRRVEPELDRALASLAEKDRALLVMRYFAGREFEAIARELGITPQAARKRTARALGKLRRLLERQGVQGVSAGVLEAGMVEHGAVSVPAEVTLAATAAGLSPGAGSGVGSIAEGAIAMMGWAKMKLVSGLASLAVVAGGTALVLPQVFAAAPPPWASPDPQSRDAKVVVVPAEPAAEEGPKLPRVIEGGDAAARLAAAFIEAFGKGDVEKVWGMFSADYQRTRQLEGTRQELQNTRAAFDMEGMHSVAVMVQPPGEAADAGGARPRQAVAVSSMADPREAGRGRGRAAFGITMVWENDQWRVRDIDLLPSGQVYSQFCRRFRGQFPGSAYVDPINTTPELTARRFVAAMSAGEVDQALALFMAPEEFAAAFEGPADIYEAMLWRAGRKLAQAERFKGAGFAGMVKSLNPGDDGGAWQAGKQYGPFKPRANMRKHDNVAATVKLSNSQEEVLRLDELIEVKGSWRIFEEPRIPPGPP